MRRGGQASSQQELEYSFGFGAGNQDIWRDGKFAAVEFLMPNHIGQRLALGAAAKHGIGRGQDVGRQWRVTMGVQPRALLRRGVA